MADIGLRLGTDELVAQGMLDEGLVAQGFSGNLSVLNITEPECVAELLRLYQVAGADCALTNTADGARGQLSQAGMGNQVAQVNAEGVGLAKQEGFSHVLACARLSSQDQAGLADLAEQVQALASAGPDALLLLSLPCSDIAAQAVKAAHEACELPVFASLALPQGDDTPGLAAVAQALAQEGAAALACDGLELQPTLGVLAALAAATDLPLAAFPCLPWAQGVRPDTAAGTRALDQVAQAAVQLRQAGAALIGTCGGSSPVVTGTIYAAVGGEAAAPRATR